MSLTVRPVPTQRALGSLVVSELRRLVITQELAPGTHLVEAQLSSMFQVSRGPIRDALRTLEAEDLVETRKGGTFVVGLSADDIEELYALRGLLELSALEECGAALPQAWGPADEAFARMEAALAAKDPVAFAQADLDLHSNFYRIAGRRRLQTVWRLYEPTFGTLLSLTNREDADLTPTLRDHARLLELARKGPSEQLRQHFRDHNDGSLRRMKRVHSRIQGSMASSLTAAAMTEGATP